MEALRTIISLAATDDDPATTNHRTLATKDHTKEARHIIITDVRRAYFYPSATRDLCIELPAEDPDADTSMVGRLNLSLYGTSGAATNWQETLSKHLLDH